MSRKHFVSLAQALAHQKPSDPAQYSQWVETCKAIASTCAQYNPAFSPTRFLDACGVA